MSNSLALKSRKGQNNIRTIRYYFIILVVTDVAIQYINYISSNIAYNKLD